MEVKDRVLDSILSSLSGMSYALAREAVDRMQSALHEVRISAPFARRELDIIHRALGAVVTDRPSRFWRWWPF
jgi:hypothetical protein